MRTHLVHELWTITALDSPRVLRRCPRCDVTRPFVSSDRFRVNAHQKRVDVWLIYRCASCDFTWNHTIAFRALPEELGRDYQRYLDNDRDAAWAAAFDARALGASGARVVLDVPYRVERTALAAPNGERVVRLGVPHPVGARLDRLLAAELGVSRAELGRWVSSGRLRAPGGSGALRRPARDGEEIILSTSGG